SGGKDTLIAPQPFRVGRLRTPGSRASRGTCCTAWRRTVVPTSSRNLDTPSGRSSPAGRGRHAHRSQRRLSWPRCVRRHGRPSWCNSASALRASDATIPRCSRCCSASGWFSWLWLQFDNGQLQETGLWVPVFVGCADLDDLLVVRDDAGVGKPVLMGLATRYRGVQVGPASFGPTDEDVEAHGAGDGAPVGGSGTEGRVLGDLTGFAAQLRPPMPTPLLRCLIRHQPARRRFGDG